MEMRAIQDGHVAQGVPIIQVVMDHGNDGAGLLVAIPKHQDTRFAARIARRTQGLLKFLWRLCCADVCNTQNFRRAAIVLLDLNNPGIGPAFPKFADIAKVRTAPVVNSLHVVADRHDVPVMCGNQIYKLRLKQIGILIFIDQDMPELLIVGSDVFLLF